MVVLGCGCGQVDVLDAYGDMEEDEIPDSYVKLHMDVAGRTDDKQTEVVNDDMTPSVRTPRRSPADLGNGHSLWCSRVH